MFQASIIQNFCDPDFAIKSFQQYAQEKADNYQKLISGLTEAAGAETLDEAKEILSSTGINLQLQLFIDESLTTVEELVTQLFSGYDRYCGTESIDPTEGPDFSITLGNVPTTFSKVCSSLKDQMLSVVSLSAGCLAQLADSAADKMAIFRDTLTDTFTEVFTQGSSFSGFFRNLYLQKPSNAEFLNSVKEFLNVEAQERATTDEELVEAMKNSDASKYAGVSPSAALNFDDLNSAVTSGLRVGAKIVGNLFKGVGKIVSKGFKWLKGKVEEITTDPIDLEDSGEGSIPVVDNMWWQGQDVTVSTSSLVYTQEQTAQFVDVGTKYIGNWIKYDLLTGIAMVRIKSVSLKQSTGNLYYPEFVLDYQWQPKVINPSMRTDFINATTFSEFSNKILSMKMNDIYNMSKTTEVQRAQGLEFARGLTIVALRTALLESIGDLSVGGGNFGGVATGNITNSDFFYLATGTGTKPSWSSGSGANYICYYLASLFVFARVDAINNPYNFVWVPYVNGREAFLPGRWRIRTDQENMDRFYNWALTAYVIVIAVAVTVAIGVTIRSVSKKIFFRSTNTISRLDSKMWSGEKLTSREKRQYLRAKRRLSLTSIWNNGLTGSKDTLSEISFTDNSQFETLISLIH